MFSHHLVSGFVFLFTVSQPVAFLIIVTRLRDNYIDITSLKLFILCYRTMPGGRLFRRGRGGPMMRGGMMRGGMMGFKPGPPYVVLSS